jgi:ATP-binding cassette subfamily C (CFTR/MRP) protein 5
VVAVMISRVRPSLNGAREALKTWDEARVIWPRIKVNLIEILKLLSYL